MMYGCGARDGGFPCACVTQIAKEMRDIMRVIAGTARRLKLETPAGRHTRPTSDKIKETLFNILQPELYDARFLDLFGGSGGIGIEALSRGAREAVFVDNDKEAVRCIKANLKHTHFEDVSRVMAMDAGQALRRLEQLGRPFDIIFMDPPYGMELERRLLPYLLESGLVEKDTLLILETSLETDLTYLDYLPCEIDRVKEYKTNRHVFLHRAEGEV
jgi:16S rRNA (guanine966-N2)-methyltransferase